MSKSNEELAADILCAAVQAGALKPFAQTRRTEDQARNLVELYRIIRDGLHQLPPLSDAPS